MEGTRLGMNNGPEGYSASLQNSYIGSHGSPETSSLCQEVVGSRIGKARWGGADMAGALSKCWVQRGLSDSPRHNWVGSTKF